MFCHKCGTKNDDGSVYCRACGEDISPEDAALLENAAPPEDTSPPEDSPPQKDAAAPGEDNVLVPLLHEPPETLLSQLEPKTVTPPAPTESAKNDPRPMKFLTRVAYNILESDRKAVALFLLALFTGLAALMAVASCLGLVSAFAGLSDANAALPSGIQSEEIQAGIDRAWRSIWSRLALLPLSFLLFYFGVRLLVRIRRVAEILKKVRKEFD